MAFLLGWLKNKSYFQLLAIFCGLLIVVLVLLWFLVFVKGPIVLTPGYHQIVANARPTLKIDWTLAFGARLKSAQLSLDGKKISPSLTLRARGFIYKPQEDLDEGLHLVEAVLDYWFILPKKVRLRWVFTTDTAPPEINFEHGNFNVLATPKDFLDLAGRTEPFSELKVTLNKKSVFVSQAAANGRFKINLKGLKKKNWMVIRAADKAGNKSKLTLPVIIDRSLPSILSFSPAPNYKVFGSNVTFNIKMQEKESEIAHVYLEVDGESIQPKFDPQSNYLYHDHPIVTDGKHQAALRVIDVAGNERAKKWVFYVDTTKLVVSRSERKLYLYKGGKLVRSFSVAVGQPAYPTPLGHWKIVGKDVMPAWYNPNKSWSASMPPYIPPGVNNPLGLRALYLNAEGIAIHGTSNIGSIGSPASHGCVRVANEEIVGLYPLVPIGVPVEVVE